MEKNHVMWKLFAITGNIDAYLLYKDWQVENNKKASEVTAEPI